MASSFATEAFTLLGVGIVVIGLRIIARTTSVGVRGLQFDDYLMCGAAVIYALETGTAYAVGAWWMGMANNGMTDEQRRTLDPESQEYHMRVGGSKTQLVGWSLYTLLLWTLKLCMCHFYSRLTLGIYHLEIRVKIGYVLIPLTYLATELSILLGCQPFSANWQIYPDPGNHCQPAISKIDLYVTVVLNVITDIYLLSIPLPMLWKANLELRRKLSLIFVFSGGVFVIMAGILRCALILSDPVNGAQQAGSWACRETFVAVVIGNVPMVYPLFRRGVQTVVRSSSYLSRHYEPNSNRNTDGNSFPLKSSFSKPARRGKLRSVNALPTTFHDHDENEDEEARVGSGSGGGGYFGWDSKERIVVESREVVVVRGKGDSDGGSSLSPTSSADVQGVAETIVEEDGEEDEHHEQHQQRKEVRASDRRASVRSLVAHSGGGGLRSVMGSVTRKHGRRRSGSDLLGGIKVTKEATVNSEERVGGGGGGGGSSPPTHRRNSTPIFDMDINWAVEVGGNSESRFKYREEDGLEYTAYVGRG